MKLKNSILEIGAASYNEADASFTLIIGCGEIVVECLIKELIENLHKVDLENIELLSGTLRAENNETTTNSNFDVSTNNMAVNPAISLSVWDTRYIEESMLKRNWRND